MTLFVISAGSFAVPHNETHAQSARCSNEAWQDGAEPRIDTSDQIIGLD
jgi:hypothetical protein